MRHILTLAAATLVVGGFAISAPAEAQRRAADYTEYTGDPDRNPATLQRMGDRRDGRRGGRARDGRGRGEASDGRRGGGRGYRDGGRRGGRDYNRGRRGGGRHFDGNGGRRYTGYTRGYRDGFRRGNRRGFRRGFHGGWGRGWGRWNHGFWPGIGVGIGLGTFGWGFGVDPFYHGGFYGYDDFTFGYRRPFAWGAYGRPWGFYGRPIGVYGRGYDAWAGAVAGGVIGGVIGNQIDGGRNRSVGTVIGALAGSALGAAVADGSDSGRAVRRDRRYGNGYYGRISDEPLGAEWGEPNAVPSEGTCLTYRYTEGRYVCTKRQTEDADDL